MNFHAPTIDYAGVSPIIALTAGICVVLIAGVFDRVKSAVPVLTLTTLGSAGGLFIWQWGERKDLVAGALRLDELAVAVALIAILAAAITVLLSNREPAVEQAGGGEYHTLLLGSVLGMSLLAEAQNLISFFVAIETLSIPLYVLCATNLRREKSLESGLKYLIIGSLGSATLLYGLAFIYGGSGSTDFTGIAQGIGKAGVLGDPLVLMGIALAATGLAFKISIGIGNIGALGQSSLKRLLGYSGVAQAGYMLGGLVVASEAGVDALVFYLAVYTLMNMAAFAVIVARERETPYGDDIRSVEGLGRERPLLAWPLTISMLALAGLPATSGFMGKLFLIEALVDGNYTWLAVAIAIGTMVSLAYYLRVVAAVWMRPDTEVVAKAEMPAIAGASPEADAIDPDAGRRAYLVGPALLAAAATVFFGVIPQPLVAGAEHAGAALAQFLP